MKFGAIQVKISIVKLLKKFRLTTCSKTINPMKFSSSAIALSPDGGMRLKLENL